MTPRRVQRRRTEPLPENTRYVGRPTVYGNPFRVGFPVEVAALHGVYGYATTVEATPVIVVALYRDLWGCRTTDIGEDGTYLHPDDRAITQGWRDALDNLRGYNLACWCPLEDERGIRVPCHADVLLDLANR